MSELLNGSPDRRDQNGNCRSGGGFRHDHEEEASGPFDIVTKESASEGRLKRWRKAALALNASCRFRYTLDFKKEEEKKQIKAKIRTHAQVIRAASLFQAAGTQINAISDYRQSLQFQSLNEDKQNTHLEVIRGGRRGEVSIFDIVVSDVVPLKIGDQVPADGIFISGHSLAIDGSSLTGESKIVHEDLNAQFLMSGCKVADCYGAMLLNMSQRQPQRPRADPVPIEYSDVFQVSGEVASKPIAPQDAATMQAAENIVLGQAQKGRPAAVMQSAAAMNERRGLVGHNEVTNNARDQGVIVSEAEVAGHCIITEAVGEFTNVGINAERGLLMASITEDNGEETPLQVRLNGIATFSGIVGLVVSLAILVILLVRYFTGHSGVGDVIDGAVQIFTVVVIIVVFAVPEGLPLAVTLMLAYSMKKMMADKALVRRLSACETMGSATTICSDKTGTLTLNLMTVVEAYVCGKKIEPPENQSLIPPKVKSLLTEGIAQNTIGHVFMPEGGGDVEVSGSPTEKAILQWGVNLGMNFNAFRSDTSIIHAFPFNSVRKRGGVAVKLPDSEVHIHWKGAAEIVLASCTRYIDANDCLVPLDQDKVLLFKKAIDDMAAGSLRCVAIAYRLFEMENIPTNEEELAHWQLPEGDLVLLAVVGLKDPCRPGVKDAVQSCMNAGVKVRMVTGDNLQTARAIALECGILGSDVDATEQNLIEGRAFRALSEMQRQEIAEKILVMGRSSPNDKLLLVQALRKRGHVVAVTGDGSNDAPALHEADIGLAMGVQGTELAKESSDIIILDNSFASVVKVVKWGRSVYANIQKFIQFQLTVNVAAFIINVLSTVSSGDVPLNAVQLLWVNLIVDTLGGLALASEPASDHLMHKPPIGRREPLITNIMWRNLLIQAMYQVTVLLVLNFRGRSILHLQPDKSDHAIKVKNTLIFNAFFLCQIFNEFNARKPDEINVFKGLSRNSLFMGIVGLALVLQVIIIMLLGKFTSTVRLSWKLWLVSIIIGFISWPLAIIGKLIPVPDAPFSEFFTRKIASANNFERLDQ